MYECIIFIHVFCFLGGKIMEVSYKIFNPAGNITALVIGDEYNLEQRRLINNLIMKKETEVEQVGFISQNKRKLTINFCGEIGYERYNFGRWKRNAPLSNDSGYVKATFTYLR